MIRESNTNIKVEKGIGEQDVEKRFQIVSFGIFKLGQIAIGPYNIFI
jgi:hypothetical protein